MAVRTPLLWRLERGEENKSKFELKGDELRDWLGDEDESYLYPYQHDALIWSYGKKLLNRRGCQAQLIQSPTGSGKTGMINLLPYYLKAHRVLIITPSRVITDQVFTTFVGNGENYVGCFFDKIGITASGDDVDRQRILNNYVESVGIITSTRDVRASYSNTVVIVNAQKFGGKSNLSLCHNDEEIVKNAKRFFKDFDLLIVDEAHHYPAKTWERIVDEFGNSDGSKKKTAVFLTATPYRTVKGEKTNILTDLEHWSPGMMTTIEQKQCVGVTTRKCRFYQSPDNFILGDRRREYLLPDGIYEFRNGVWKLREGVYEYPEGVYKDAKVVYQDLKRIFKKNETKQGGPSKGVINQGMILVSTRKEAELLVNALNDLAEDASYAAEIISGEKKQNLEEFTNQKVTIGVTCQIGTEGYDNSNIVVCVILRRIVTGRILFAQFVGRCVRMRHGEEKDKSDIGVVLSYPEFNQRKLWRELNEDALPKEDPEEPKGEEEPGVEESPKKVDKRKRKKAKSSQEEDDHFPDVKRWKIMEELSDDEKRESETEGTSESDDSAASVKTSRLALD